MSADRLLALAAIVIAAAGMGLALWVAIWMRRVRGAQSALLSGLHWIGSAFRRGWQDSHSKTLGRSSAMAMSSCAASCTRRCS